MNSMEYCPVCGMQTEAGECVVEYQKMYFHFCSEQCRKTFQTHPEIYSGKRVKEIGEVIKRRRLRFAESLNPETEKVVSTHLKTLMGIKEFSIMDRCLTIRYDLLQLTLAQIESALNEVGIKLDRNWRQKLRRTWIHETEHNELDNLASTPGACCNHAPPRV